MCHLPRLGEGHEAIVGLRLVHLRLLSRVLICYSFRLCLGCIRGPNLGQVIKVFIPRAGGVETGQINISVLLRYFLPHPSYLLLAKQRFCGTFNNQLKLDILHDRRNLRQRNPSFLFFVLIVSQNLGYKDPFKVFLSGL